MSTDSEEEGSEAEIEPPSEGEDEEEEEHQGEPEEEQEEGEDEEAKGKPHSLWFRGEVELMRGLGFQTVSPKRTKSSKKGRSRAKKVSSPRKFNVRERLIDILLRNY